MCPDAPPESRSARWGSRCDPAAGRSGTVRWSSPRSRRPTTAGRHWWTGPAPAAASARRESVNVRPLWRRRAELGHTFLRYLFQELHSGFQALHLPCHILQQADPSACGNQANAFINTWSPKHDPEERSPEMDWSFLNIPKQKWAGLCFQPHFSWRT